MEKEKNDCQTKRVDSDCTDHSDYVANEEQHTSPFDRLPEFLWLSTLYLAVFILLCSLFKV